MLFPPIRLPLPGIRFPAPDNQHIAIAANFQEYRYCWDVWGRGTNPAASARVCPKVADLLEWLMLTQHDFGPSKEF
jgi:hypothetical protein